MTSLKTKNICFLAAFLFLAIVPTLAKVVDDVKKCDKFLHKETLLDIKDVLEGGVSENNNRYKIICQTYNGQPRYLTVYDIENKIPVFSAYEYKGSGGVRKDNWMIEPQLESGNNLDDNMMKEVTGTDYNNQAIDDDYINAQKKIGQTVIKYDRGHLFPVYHASDQDELDSTFALTNAVPQVDNFNRGRWKTMEGNIKKEMDEQKVKDNNNRCFVVVGAQPSDNSIANNKLNNRVNIPKVMWSGFYCTNGVSGAYWDDNIKRGQGAKMTSRTLDELKEKLKGQKRSSSDSQKPQASKQSRKSRSPSSSAGNS